MKDKIIKCIFCGENYPIGILDEHFYELTVLKRVYHICQECHDHTVRVGYKLMIKEDKEVKDIEKVQLL